MLKIRYREGNLISGGRTFVIAGAFPVLALVLSRRPVPNPCPSCSAACQKITVQPVDHNAMDIAEPSDPAHAHGLVARAAELAGPRSAPPATVLTADELRARQAELRVLVL